jgi:hypothetical protein
MLGRPEANIPADRRQANILPLVLTALLAGGATAYGLGGYPLLEPDEGRNAEVAREMAETNQYVLPRLNGLPYLDKPVLYFAAGALAMEVLGPTETAARLPSLVFALLTVALVAWFARRLYGTDGAWTAAIACAASPFTLAYARTVIMDSAVTLWMTAAIAAWYLAAEPPTANRQPPTASRRWGVAGWAAAALGVLTKGPVALAVPLMVMVPYGAWRRRLGAIFDPVGLLVFLAIVLPWVFAVSRPVPDFLHYVLVVETGQRLATGALGRSEARWYFVAIFPAAALPWSVIVLASLRRPAPARTWDPRVMLLCCWIVIPLLFFTLSQSKRPQYVLPLVPAVALAVAHVWRDGRRVGATRVAGGVMAALGAGLWLAGGPLSRVFPASPETAQLIPPTARWLGALALVAGGLAIIWSRRAGWSLAALAFPVLAIPVAGVPLLGAIARDRSSADVAAAMRPLLSPRTEIVAVGVYPLSLPFYLGRSLTLVTADGRELTSNYVPRRHDLLRLSPNATLRPPGWWEDALTFCDRPRLFVVPADARAVRDRLAETLPLVVTSRKVAVYGPCGGDALAGRGLRAAPRALSHRSHLSRKGEGRG